MANPLFQKHIISINDLSREDLELVPVSYTHLTLPTN